MAGPGRFTLQNIQWESGAILAGSACLIMYLLLTNSNTEVFLYLNEKAAILGPEIWKRITILGDALVSGMIFFIFIRKDPKLVLAFLIAGLLAFISSHLLKAGFSTLRPPGVLAEGTFILSGPALTTRAFPSGHTTAIFTLCTVLLLSTRHCSIRGIAILSACLVGFSRIAVGVHWPIDVAGGAMLGTLCTLAAIWVIRVSKAHPGKWFSLILGIIFMVQGIYLIFYYDNRMPGSRYFQQGYALACMIPGAIALWKLVREKFGSATTA